MKVMQGFLLFSLQLCGLLAFAQMPLLAPLPKTGSLSKPADGTKFVFVLAGDNRPAHASCPQPPTPGKIFAAVKAMTPAASFVLWTGDTISGKDPKNKTIHDQFSGYRSHGRRSRVQRARKS